MSAYDTLQSILQPIIVDYAVFIFMGGAAWFFRFLPSKWRLEVEARHREALHKAINTGVGLALDTIQLHPAVATADLTVTQVVNYVKRSVPDALKKLGPSEAQLVDMARSKIQERVDAVIGRDRLSEALVSAGLPATAPR